MRCCKPFPTGRELAGWKSLSEWKYSGRMQLAAGGAEPFGAEKLRRVEKPIRIEGPCYWLITVVVQRFPPPLQSITTPSIPQTSNRQVPSTNPTPNGATITTRVSNHPAVPPQSRRQRDPKRGSIRNEGRCYLFITVVV